MTPPESPASLLERAATRLDTEGGTVTRPVSNWLREVAERLRDRGVQTYYEEHAVDVATAIVCQPETGESP